MDWLLHRTDLFERICFPSVASQTDQDFTWILWVDLETPSDVLHRLYRLQRQRHFEVNFISYFDEAVAAEQVRKYVTGTPYLLTTRLDNDDALAKDYFQILKLHVKPFTPSWINFDHGLQAGPIGVYRMYRRSNAFISLIERSDKPNTVMCIKHSKAVSVAPIVHLDGHAWWLQVVHGRNLMNYISRPSRVLTWNKAEVLMTRFCDQVVSYVRERYLTGACTSESSKL
jgi:hypothetical protein